MRRFEASKSAPVRAPLDADLEPDVPERTLVESIHEYIIEWEPDAVEDRKRALGPWFTLSDVSLRMTSPGSGGEMFE